MAGYGMGAETLLLFTYSYPFGASESFLETEIQYLASAWRRVVIIPARAAGTAREVPANVEVELGLTRTLARRTSPAEIVRSMADPWFRAEIKRFTGATLRIVRLQRLLGQLLAARVIGGWIDGYLLRSGVERRRILCYSYWLSQAALGLAWLRRSSPEIAFVARAHGYDLYAERHDPPYLPLQRETVRRSDAIFAISEHGRVYLRSMYPELASKVEVVRLGVPSPELTSPRSTDGRWRILSCSALTPVKRVDMLVRGLAEAARRTPGTAIEWCHLGDGPLRGRIEDLARRELPKNVHWWIRGQLPSAAVYDHYRSNAVDVFVNVSESEGIPVSIMEAQSFGVPVIAPAVGGIPEIVGPGNGILLDAGPTAVNVAMAIEQICSLPSGDGSLRRASRASYEARYDAAVNYTLLVERLKVISASKVGSASASPREAAGEEDLK